MLGGMRILRSLPLSVALLTALSFGCAPPETAEEPIVLETEDIGPAEPELDLSADQVAKRRSRGLGGQLPIGFPEGMPLFQPSSIIDIGEGGTGGYVLFETPADRAAVEGWLRPALGRGGWSVTSDSGGVLSVTRGQGAARITISDAGPVTAIRIEY
jgi:hypothetical protein